MAKVFGHVSMPIYVLYSRLLGRVGYHFLPHSTYFLINPYLTWQLAKKKCQLDNLEEDELSKVQCESTIFSRHNGTFQKRLHRIWLCMAYHIYFSFFLSLMLFNKSSWSFSIQLKLLNRLVKQLGHHFLVGRMSIILLLVNK